MASKSSKRRQKRRRRAAANEGTAAPPGDERAADASGHAVPSHASSAGTRRSGTPNDPDGPPPAPWGSFPLVELAVLVGIVMLVLGFFFVGGERGALLIGCGLLLASIAGVEVAIREHFAGYRSHTLILAGLPAAAVLGLLFFAGPDGLPATARAAVGVGVFAGAAVLLTRIFRNRSGGHSFRLTGFRRR